MRWPVENGSQSIIHESTAAGSPSAHPFSGMMAPQFQGRDEDISSCLELLNQVEQGILRAAFVEGKSGEGKSYFLHQVQERCVAKGAMVLRTQGSVRSAQQPFESLRVILSSLLQQIGEDEVLKEKLLQNLRGHESLIGIFPELEWIGVQSDASEPLLSETPSRFYSSVSKLLDILESIPCAKVFMIDDCQWVDISTLRAIGAWIKSRATEAPLGGPSSLWIFAFRQDELPADHVLYAYPVEKRIRLKPLTPEEVRKMAESVLGPLPGEALALAYQVSEGNPFAALSSLLGLVDTRLIRLSERGDWVLDSAFLQNESQNLKPMVLLLSRLKILSEEIRQCLMLGALWGKWFPVRLIAESLGQSQDQVRSLLEEAQKKHFVWTKRDEGICVFTHDKIREAFLNMISVDEKRRWSEQIATVLTHHHPQPLFEIVYHYAEAERHDLAYNYAMRAGDKAGQQYDFELSERMYRIALAGSKSKPERLRATKELAYVLSLQGKYAESERWYQKAYDEAEDPLSRAILRSRLGETAFKKGDVTAAASILEEALESMGIRIPRTWPAGALALTRELITMLLHTLFPRFFIGRKQCLPTESEKLVIGSLSRLAYAYWFYGGRIYTAWAHLKEMNIAESYLPTPELAQAYSEHAPVMTMIPYFRRAHQYTRKSLRIRRGFSDDWGIGQSLHFRGVVNFAAARYRRAVADFSRAIRILTKAGDHWEKNTASWHLAYCHHFLGDLAQAERVAQKTYKEATELGDFQAASLGLSIWAKASRGRAPGPLLKTAVENCTEDLSTLSEIVQGEVVRLCAHGEIDEAIEVLEKAWNRISQRKIKQVYVSQIRGWMATCFRLKARHHFDRWDVKGAARSLNRAILNGLQACIWGMQYPVAAPHAFREMGLALSMKGFPNWGRRFLDRSIAISRRQQADFELMQSLCVRHFIDHHFLYSVDEADLHEAQKLVETHQLQERFLLLADPILALRPTSVIQEEAAGPLKTAEGFFDIFKAGPSFWDEGAEGSIMSSLDHLITQLLPCDGRIYFKWGASSEGHVLIQALGERTAWMSSEEARKCFISEDSRFWMSPPPAEDRYMYIPIRTRGGPWGGILLVRGGPHASPFSSDEESRCAFLAWLAGTAIARQLGLKELAETNQRLEEELDTQIQIQKELQKFQWEAQQANQAKDKFLATISHEIRTPLSAILGFSELLSEQFGAPESVEVIQRNARHLLRIVNEILDLAKVRSGRLAVRRKSTSLFEVMDEVLSAILPQVRQREQQLRISYDLTPVQITTDPVRLVQILINILGNAVKFTPRRGRIDLLIGLTQDKTNAFEQLSFKITDTGPGIPPELRDQVFEPFTQGENSLARDHDGTGLGLPLSRELAILLGGQLWLEDSASGKGSTFVVTIDPRPSLLQGAETYARPWEVPNGLAKRRRLLSGRRILLAEDMQDNQLLISTMLKAEGASVDIAVNGEDAVNKASLGRYDLILMDIQMPLMDGHEATRFLRDMGVEVPIVALTANAMAGDRALSLKAGCSEHLTKPVSKAKLVDCLHRILTEAGA